MVAVSAQNILGFHDRLNQLLYDTITAQWLSCSAAGVGDPWF